MASKRRGNTLTRFLEDIVDDTKDFVDDLLDRAKDLEEDARDAVKDFNDDDDDDDRVSTADVATLRASLASLQAKVDELTALQVKANTKTTSSTGSKA
ncbi:MAG TPA: hypothetical protein VEG38_15035 [Acidimicrobiia bacterium]|nr:hypothetical protein [Acidimicrobiia bacterium]